MKNLLVLIFGITLLGCQAGENQTNIELIQDMMDQINVKTQDWDPDVEDYSTVMTPPEGTVSQNRPPYKYDLDPKGAERNLKNPLANDYGVETLKLGKLKYEIYCMVCHGAGGAGDGTVAEKMTVKPPSLLSAKVRKHNDARIYHIVTNGQGVMGQYASQIHDEKSRWAIVNYVRTLQKQAN
ncbi:MAG: cytochrome c [Pseudomonadota bacterium]